jgi:hypothetical protein
MPAAWAKTLNSPSGHVRQIVITVSDHEASGFSISVAFVSEIKATQMKEKRMRAIRILPRLSRLTVPLIARTELVYLCK